MTIFSRIETEVSDRLLIYSIKNKIKYPSRHCVVVEDAVNAQALKSMKNGETIIMRQVSMQLLAANTLHYMPTISKFFALETYCENYGGYFQTIDAIDFPDPNNLSVDFVSAHKENGKYTFRALEANGSTHSVTCGLPSQIVNDAIKDEILRILGIEKKRIADGVLDSSDKEEYIAHTIEWLAGQHN